MIKKQKTIRKSFPKVNKYSNRDRFFYVVDCRSKLYGTKSQLRFYSEAEAIRKADEIQSKLVTEGTLALRVKSDAENIRLKSLEDGLPAGITLESVLNRFKEEQAKQTRLSFPEVEPLVNEWYLHKENNVLNQITKGALRDCKSYCVWINAHWGKLKCNEVTQAMVEAAISEKQGTKGTTKRKYLLHVSSFYKWLIEKKQIPIPNPAKGIDIAIEETIIQIYSIEDIRRMLEYTEQNAPHMACFFVLCTWVGARPSECYRMTWADVSFENSEIAVDPEGKTGARYIHAEPVIMEYLKKRKEASPDMPLVPKYAENQDTLFRAKIRRDLPLKWIHSGLRHNAVTYFYAVHKDWEKVEFRFGHDKGTSRKHYMRPISKETVDTFWNMLSK